MTLQHRLQIINRRGLHARAAAKLAATCAQFDSRIAIGTNEPCADGKNIMALMMLAASQGTELTIHIDGNDAEHAWQAIRTLVAERFHEDE